jgi:hypothetical protein
MNMTADAYSAQVLGLSSTALEAVCVGAHGDLPQVIGLFEEDANVVQCTNR